MGQPGQGAEGRGEDDKPNTELVVIGQGLYGNWRVAVAAGDHRYFRIVPKPFPILAVGIMNLLLAAFFCGFGWAAKN